MDAVCFDLDDTLFDYHEYARAGLRSAAGLVERETGEQVYDDLERLYFDDDVTEGTFDVLLERRELAGVDVGALVEAFHDSTGELEPYPQTEPVLEALARDVALGLLSDGRGGHAKLERLDLDDYFDAVLISPTIDASKRDREVFDRVLDALDVDPTAAAYVGDDPRVDFRLPNDLGMTTVRLRRGRYVDLEPEDDAAAPDHELDALDELLTGVPALRGTDSNRD